MMNSKKLRIFKGIYKKSPLLFALFLGGCISLWPEDQIPPQRIVLDVPTPPNTMAFGKVFPPIAIELPAAQENLTSARMVIREENPSGLITTDFIAGVSWSENIPSLIQGEMLKAFEKSHVSKGVGRPTEGFTPSYLLETDLRRFDVVVRPHHQGSIDIEWSCKLLSFPGRDILSQRVFQKTIPVKSLGVHLLREAFQKAMALNFYEMILWTQNMLTQKPSMVYPKAIQKKINNRSKKINLPRRNKAHSPKSKSSKTLKIQKVKK